MLLAVEQAEEESIMVHKLILSSAFLLSESVKHLYVYYALT